MDILYTRSLAISHCSLRSTVKTLIVQTVWRCDQSKIKSIVLDAHDTSMHLYKNSAQLMFHEQHKRCTLNQSTHSQYTFQNCKSYIFSHPCISRCASYSPYSLRYLYPLHQCHQCILAVIKVMKMKTMRDSETKHRFPLLGRPGRTTALLKSLTSSRGDWEIADLSSEENYQLINKRVNC